jgi:uncharacterized membrane protein
VDQCVHLALARADLVVLAQVVQVVQVLVVQVADQVVLVVLVLVARVAVSVVLVLVARVADLVVLVVVVPVAVLAVAVTVNAVHQRRSHVLVVVKTSMKCCHRQPRRIRKAMLQFLKALSLSNVVLRRKSLHQS